MTDSSFPRVLRVLIVDDDEVDRLAIRRCLERGGLQAEIDEVANASGIVDRTAGDSYDCILLDASLPGTTGKEVVVELRTAGVRTPVIVVSGFDEEVGAELVAAGATDYLSKPDLSAARLSGRIRYAIQLVQAERRAHRASTQLEAERRLLATVLEQLPVGVIMTDAALSRVLLANDCADELAPGIVRAIVPNGEPPMAAATLADELIREAVSAGETKRESKVQVGDKCLRFTATPVHGSGDAGGAAILLISDITAEVAVGEAALRTVQAREDVLAVVSHDLRGPLGAINVATEALADPELSTDDRRRYAQAIQRSSRRADLLIQDLLDVSVIEANGLGVAKAEVACRQLLTQAAADNELVAEDFRMSLTVSEVDEGLVVFADRNRLLQALTNLIRNSLQHARGHGPIELGARTDGQTVSLTVRDHGPGLSAGSKHKLFDRFWQARPRAGGAGLGLAIVRGIVEAHGGCVRALNAEGGGAQFELELPARA